jgi:hypothetical protein
MISDELRVNRQRLRHVKNILEPGTLLRSHAARFQHLWSPVVQGIPSDNVRFLFYQESLTSPFSLH